MSIAQEDGMIVVRGRSIWDPRLGPSSDLNAWGFSENPALIMLDMILEAETPLPAGFMDQLLKAADHCDQALATKADA